MQLSIIRRKDNLDASTRKFAERRFLFALSRFASRIDHVSVVVDDINGPRGGVDQSCRVSVKLGRLGTVTVTTTDAEVGPTLARAADRVGRAVARRIEKDQQIDRRSLRSFVD